MDIHHFIGKLSHTQTHWVYTQKGYEHIKQKLPNADHKWWEPGKPVPEHYRQSCPMWWTYNGWVEEAVVEGQLTLF